MSLAGARIRLRRELSILLSRRRWPLEGVRKLGLRLADARSVGSGSSGEDALVRAIKDNDPDQIKALLSSGADPNQQDLDGQTALHQAVLRGHTDIAGCLLAYGADPALRNQSGRPALGPATATNTTLHRIRQSHRRFTSTRPPSASTQGQELLSTDCAVWNRELNRDGIIKLPGLIKPDCLADMQEAMHNLVADIDNGIGNTSPANRVELSQAQANYDDEEYYSPSDNSFVTNNAFKHWPHLAQVAASTPITELATLYFGRQPHITRGMAMHYPPQVSTGKEQFRWHHDMEDKRLKLMILLSDIGESDQYMSYLIGSHVLLHPLRMFYTNSCPPSYCEKKLGPLQVAMTTGKAGDAFVFDSNGAHRGNRKAMGATRSALFVEFCPDPSDIWGGYLDPHLKLDNPALLDQFLRTSPKWQQQSERQHPTWIESLHSPQSWTPSAAARPTPSD